MRVLASASLIAQGVALDFERRDVRGERGDDRTAHGGQQVVEVLNHGAVHRAVFEQLFAAQDRVVVLADLRRDRIVGDRRHDGDQTARVVRVGEVGADELRHADLVLDRDTFGPVARTLGDAAGRFRRDVDHAVALFDVLDAAVHLAQLAADHLESVLDEVGRRARDAALVLDGVLVVDGDERVDHVLGALRHRVVHRDGDDRGLFVRHVALHGAAVGVRRRIERALGHVDRGFPRRPATCSRSGARPCGPPAWRSCRRIRP